MDTQKKPLRRKRAEGELTIAQAKRLPVVELTADMEEAVVLGARKHAGRFQSGAAR